MPAKESSIVKKRWRKKVMMTRGTRLTRRGLMMIMTWLQWIAREQL
jgi:hypothetical protein